jgi:hypothetical protein
MTETRKTFLGVISLEPDEVIHLDIPLDADPETIKALIEKAEAEKIIAAKAESERLREMFLPPTGEAEKGDEQGEQHDE